MTRIYSGTATVTNGDATVVITSGDPLTTANCPTDAPIALNGVAYYVASRTDTAHLELTRPYAGSTGSVAVEIDPLTPDALSVVNIAVLVARVQAQLNVLDKNSQGLFYNRIGVTGDTDPAPGNLAFDDEDPTAVSEFYIDNIDANQRPVTGLLDLWSAGTTVLIRSLATTAYVAYRLPSGVSVQSGYYKAETQYVDHDGVLADGEAISIGWFRVGEGLDIDATGTLAGRAAYDEQSAGFVYVTDTGDLYRKNTATSGDWGPAIPFQGPAGDRGWAPRFAVVADGERRVMQLAGYVGGTGDTPTANIGQYVSTGGYTGTIGSATDIRGGIGLSAYEVAVLAGFVGDADAWLASLVGLSAYQVALANGYVGDAASWLASLVGIPGTDPGVLMIWDNGTTDANPGAGVVRANNALTSSATFLYVSKTNRPGDSIATFLASLDDSNSNRKGIVTLTKSGGSAQTTFDVTAVTDATGYVKVAVTNGSGATFLDNDIVSFQFAPAGDRGTDGLGAGNFITVSEPEVDPTGNIVVFADETGTNGEDSEVPISDVVRKSNNGTDFGNKRATFDNLHLAGADVASAATVNLETTTGIFVEVTGTTTTTAITLSDGHQRLVRAAAAWPLTHSTNLQIQGGASYTCAAGDMLLIQADGAVIRVSIFKVDGKALVASGGDVVGPASTTLNAFALFADTTGKLLKTLSYSAVTALLSAMAGDTGTGGTKGLVPAPAAGDAAAGKVLGAGGAWIAVDQTSASEKAEWLHRAALLDPAAYTYFTGLFDVTVPAGETWLVVNAWWCNFGSSTGLWFHRNLKVSEAFELPAGSQVKAVQASSFLWVCRPALVSGNTEYLTPKDLYFSRLAALRAIVPSQLTVSVPAGSARGTVVTTNFPTDFEDAMLLQVSTNDLTWTVLGLNDGAGGGNTLDEISDDHQMRLTGKMLVPLRRKLMPRIQGRGSSISGNATDVAIANGHDVLLYQKLPPTWRTDSRSFYREAVLADAPLLYYGMDEASGSTIASIGSSTTAANVVSPVLFGAPGAPGDNGTGILLSSGDDGRLEIPGSAGLNFGAGDFALEGWVKFKTVPNLAAADPWLVNAWQDDIATPNSFLLSVYSQKLRFFWRNSAATTVTVDSTITLVPGKYYHYIAGRNGSNIFIRIVGAETRQTAAVTGTMATLGTNKVPLGIGRAGAVFNYRLDGSLDELAIYSYALSDARAVAHHAAALGWG